MAPMVVPEPRDEALCIHAPWFETVLTPELYFHDPRTSASDADSSVTEEYQCGDFDCDESASADDMSVASGQSQWSDGFEIQAVTYIPVHLYASDDRVNRFAFDCLHRGFVSFQQLLVLSEMLPMDNKTRRHVLNCVNMEHTCLATRCFTTGAYVHGGDAGTRNSLNAFPWVAKLLCGIVRATAGDRPFTSVALALNQWSGVHVDSHNSKTFHNILVPAGCWDGGEVWTANAHGSIPFPGTGLLGDIHPVRHPYILLDATLPHAVMPWSGERLMVCTYHIRDAWRLRDSHLSQLREAGFVVATCERDTDPYM